MNVDLIKIKLLTNMKTMIIVFLCLFMASADYCHTSGELLQFSHDAQNVMDSRFGTSIAINGPLAGYDGAKYELSNSTGVVSWSSSNTSVATINGQGVLTVKSNGTTLITATCKGQNYSKKIVVGIPRYVLSAEHIPGGYKVDATCIDNQFKSDIEIVNRTLQFQWGMKFPDREIEWISTNSPSVKLQLLEKEVSVFFKVTNSKNLESVVQTVKVETEDIYNSSGKNLYIDANGAVFDESKYMDKYKNGRIYLTRNKYKDEKYESVFWQAVAANVLSPFSSSYRILIRDRGQ